MPRDLYISLCVILAGVHSRPLDEQGNVLEGNDSLGQDRASVLDVLNRLTWDNLTKAENANNGLLNRPLQALVDRNNSQRNLLNDVKLFFITTQGAIMPASVITGGFTNFLQSLGSMGNMFGNLGQSLQNLNPLNQNRQ